MGNGLIEFLNFLAKSKASIRVSWTGFRWVEEKLKCIVNKEEDDDYRKEYTRLAERCRGVIKYVGEDFICLGPSGENDYNLLRIIPIGKIDDIEILGGGSKLLEQLASESSEVI